MNNQRKSTLVAIVLGALFGLFMRVLFEYGSSPDNFAVEIVSQTFAVVVPFCVGAVAVYFASREQPISWVRQLGVSCVAMLVFLLAMLALFLEGFICIALIAPIFLVMSMLGGLVMGLAIRWRSKRAALSIALVLPFVLGPIEARFTPETALRTVSDSVVIAAPAELLWETVVNVADIKPEEFPLSFNYLIGVPRPVSASMDAEGIGSVRVSTWEKGVHFSERITLWKPPHVLDYEFDIPLGAIPRHALDRHVEIGGKYFDVIRGGYRFRELGDNRTEVTLHTTYRNTSHLQLYGNIWGDFVIGDFHRSVLHLIGNRALASSLAMR